MKSLSEIIIIQDADFLSLSLSLSSSNNDGSNIYDRLYQEIIIKYFRFDNISYDKLNKMLNNLEKEYTIITKKNNLMHYSNRCYKDLYDRGVNFICCGNKENAMFLQMTNLITKIKNKEKTSKSLVVMIISKITEELINFLEFYPDIILITLKKNEDKLFFLKNDYIIWEDVIKKTIIINVKEDNYNLVKKEILIFHDSENCNFMDTNRRIIDGNMLYYNVLNNVIKKCFTKNTENIDEKELLDYDVNWNLIMSNVNNTNKNYMPSDTCLNSLIDKGVNYIYAGDKNNAVDIKIKDLILRTIIKYKNDNIKPLIVLITSDRDFGIEIRSLLLERFPILIISDKTNVRKAFLENVSINERLDNWKEIIEDSSINNFDTENNISIEINTCHEMNITKYEYIYYTNYNPNYLQNAIKEISPNFNIEILKNPLSEKYSIFLKLYNYKNCKNKSENLINKATILLEQSIKNIIIENYNDNNDSIKLDDELKKISKNNKILFFLYKKEEDDNNENILYMQIPSVCFQMDPICFVRDYMKNKFNIINLQIVKIKSPKFHLKLILNKKDKKHVLNNNMNENDKIYFYDNIRKSQNIINDNVKYNYFIVYHKDLENTKNEIIKNVKKLKEKWYSYNFNEFINTNKIDNIKLENIKNIWFYFENKLKKEFKIDIKLEDDIIKINNNIDIDKYINYVNNLIEDEILEHKYVIYENDLHVDFITSIKEYLQYLKKKYVKNNLSRFNIKYPSKSSFVNNDLIITILSVKEEKYIFDKWNEELSDLIENFTTKIINISSINYSSLKNKINYINLKNKYNLALCNLDNVNLLLKITGSTNNVNKCLDYLTTIDELKNEISKEFKIFSLPNLKIKNNIYKNLLTKTKSEIDKIYDFILTRLHKFKDIKLYYIFKNNNYEDNNLFILLGNNEELNECYQIISNLLTFLIISFTDRAKLCLYE